MGKLKKSTRRGIFYMVIASLGFATMAAFVKILSYNLPPFEIVFFRSLFGSLIMAAVLFRKRKSFIGTNPKMLIWRGVFGFVALLMNFYSISELNLGTAVMLNNTSPIFVAVLSSILLKERISLRLWILTLACFAGVYLLTAHQLLIEPFPVVVGILSGVFAAAAFLTISVAEESESSYTIIFYFTTISAIGSLPFLKLGYVTPHLNDWWVIGGIAITSFFAQVYVTRSFRIAPPSVVSPFGYLMPVCSFGYGFLLWRDPITPNMFLGALLIIVSGVTIYLFEHKARPLTD